MNESGEASGCVDLVHRLSVPTETSGSTRITRSLTSRCCRADGTMLVGQLETLEVDIAKLGMVSLPLNTRPTARTPTSVEH